MQGNNEWAYCPTCGTRTDNEKIDSSYYCRGCGKLNPLLIVRRENMYVEQAQVTQEAV